MKTLVWILFGLLSLLWTGGAWVLARLGDWAAGLAASGGTVDWVGKVAESPPMLMLARWLDAAWYQRVQDAMIALLQGLGEGLPLLGSALTWLAPLTWIIWAFGMLILLLLAGGAHLLLGRMASLPMQPSAGRSL
nr:hypothetical protein [uncultured Roseateles sp.]